MLQKNVFGKGIKPNNTLLKSLVQDLEWVFSTQQSTAEQKY